MFSTHLYVSLFYAYISLMVWLDVGFCLETLLRSKSALCKCLLAQKSNALWFLSLCMTCCFPLEQILSLLLGILKFCNAGPWHGFIPLLHYVYCEPIKSGNISISSEKFLKWFLWKFLPSFSLSGMPSLWLLDLQTAPLTSYPVLLLSVSLPFYFTFWKIFFNSSFLAL